MDSLKLYIGILLLILGAIYTYINFTKTIEHSNIFSKINQVESKSIGIGLIVFGLIMILRNV